MNKKLISVLIAMFCLAAVATANEEFPNRTFIKSQEGMVRIKKAESKWVKPEKDMALEIGDMVKTLSNGKVEIVLAGTAVIKVNPDSEFVIPEDKANNPQKVSFIKMLKGVLWARAKEDNDSLKVATPNAICGVRGTEFMLEVTRDSMILTVSSGAVAFVPLVMGVTPKAQLVQKGQQIHFKPEVAKQKAAEAKKQEEKKKEEAKETKEETKEEAKEEAKSAKEEAKAVLDTALSAISIPQGSTAISEQATSVYDQVISAMETAAGGADLFDTSVASESTFIDHDLQTSGMVIQEITAPVEQVLADFNQTFSGSTAVTDYVQEIVDNTTADILKENNPSSATDITSDEYGQVKVTW
ncbi:MAG: FecR family protein [Candidatus Wallbacteria bacterium]|nr:FecR family protein [Candidatus Wallbacteria bacterium]